MKTNKGFAPLIGLLIAAVVIGGGVYAYEKFYKTDSASSGVAQDFYKGNVKVSGSYSYNQFVGAYPRLQFTADAESSASIPRENGDVRSAWFSFENTDEALSSLGLNPTKLGNSICEIKGTATIEISDYKVLKAELGGSDTAHLGKVLASNAPQLVECSTN